MVDPRSDYTGLVHPRSDVTDVLIKMGNLDIDVHTDKIPYEDVGSNQDDASISQGRQRLPVSHQKLVEGHGTDSSS